ncbi:MAG: type II toxin-antitoxin system VapC family toxin [Magnetococcales bacterium]|nr:type II toxin-antitoxin system VapC family toxin [Magnetococcales bacterium]NGZ07154.1 type II toxin-antitoxin system VapC family toxin [Magnetococcales bacterium]
MRCLFDSNPLIYFLNGVLPSHGREWIREGIRFGGAYSVITRIEILGFPESPERTQAASRLLQRFTEIALSEVILQRTIHLRRQYRRLKIPDAIIAATAMESALPLITHNLDDFTGIAGLIVKDPFHAPP